MKKRGLSALLAIIMVLALVPTVAVQPAQAVSRVSEAEISRLVNQYMTAIGLTSEDCTYFWNRNVTSPSTLEAQLDAFRASGKLSDLTGHLNKSRCYFSGSHLRANGCTSNSYRGSSQCRGFVRYFLYYLYGKDPFYSPSSYNTYTSATASWESIGGLRMGDHVDYDENVFNHPFIYYSGTGTNDIKAIHANGRKSLYPCGINFGKVYHRNTLSASEIEEDYRNGKVTIRRYINPCDHQYKFVNDNKVVCKNCNGVYAIPTPTAVGVYMDVVGVNGSGTAPAHKTPYGSATIGARYEKGHTVYVVGSAKNAFGNKWYKLSTGEWMTADYLGDHIHCWASGGFCTHCVDENIQVVNLKAVSVSVKSDKKAPVHFAPYGDSLTFSTRTGSVTVNGKVINGYGTVWYRLTNGAWVFSDYLAAFDDSKHIAPPTVDSEPSDDNSGDGGSSGGGGSSNGNIAQGDNNGSAGATGLVKVQYPTNQTYLNKFSIGTDTATVVAHITKPAGYKVTSCGFLLYAEDGGLIWDHREPITNVSDSLTSFHAWYDFKADAGVALIPDTTFRYQFYAVVNDVIYFQDMQTFTTKPDPNAPVEEVPQPVQYTLTFDPNGGTCATESKPVTYNTAVGTLPEPTRSGYTFSGWYTAAEDGSRINSQTNYNAAYDVIVYAHWTPLQFKLIFDPNGGSCGQLHKNVTFDTKIGDLPTPTLNGYTFAGWYTKREDGNNVNEQTRYNAPYDFTVYARWTVDDRQTGASAMKDVPAGAWYYKAVDFVVRNGVMGGYNDSTFGPDDSLNRAMLVQMLYNREGKPSMQYKDQFTDVSISDWYSSAVSWASHKGIVSGYGTTYKPTNAITRQELAQILYNYALKPNVTSDLSRFPDADKVDGWARNAVTWAVENGIMGGKGGGMLDPLGKATRAEAAQMLTNFINAGME